MPVGNPFDASENLLVKEKNNAWTPTVEHCIWSD